jgi:4-hydroxybenzoyl-CoA thioesterase
MAFLRQELVRFQHCDPAGIVFYPRAFEMINATVEDWFAALGMPFSRMHGPERHGVPTAEIAVTFARPMRLGETLDLALRLVRLGRSSAGLTVAATCNGQARFSARSTLVWVNMDTGRPTPWPGDLRARMAAELEETPDA